MYVKMPPKKKKPLKKQPIQKQKQKQNQRVTVNISHPPPVTVAKKRRRNMVSKPRQQVASSAPVFVTNYSPPLQPYYNPSPIQTSSGFTPSAQIPTSLGSPVELPVFSKEPVRVIGNSNVSLPSLPAHVRVPTPIIVPIQPVIPAENRIVIPAPSYRPPPESIISIPQYSLMTDNNLIPPPPPIVSRNMINYKGPPSVSSIITADDNNRSRSSVFNYDEIFPARSSISSYNKGAPPNMSLSAPEYYVGENSLLGPESISSNSGFNVPINKSTISKTSSIAGRKMFDEPPRSSRPPAGKGMYNKLTVPELYKIATERGVPVSKKGYSGKDVRRTKAEIQAELYKMDSGI